MKKKIGILVILSLLVLSSQAFAGSISQIGKKVAGESSVYFNEIQLNDAIIVDGASYAPLRSVSEAIGADISFEKTKEGNVIKMNTPELTREETNALIWKKAELEASIKGEKNTIERANQAIEASNKRLEVEKNEDYINFYNQEIQKSQEEIIQAQQDIITYTNELLELESAK